MMIAGMVFAMTVGVRAENPLYRQVTESIAPSGSYNVVTYAAPRAVKLAELGLLEAGLKGGPVFRVADEIRVFVSREKIEESPKARIWFNTREHAWWYNTGGQGSAEEFVLNEGEVLMIVTKASKDMIVWKNPLLFP